MPWHPYRPAPCKFIICYNSQFVKILRGFRENIKMFFFFNCRAMVIKTSSPQISSFPSSFPFLESVASLSLWLSMNLAILCLASSSAILWALSSPHAPSKPGFVFPWPNLVYRCSLSDSPLPSRVHLWVPTLLPTFNPSASCLMQECPTQSLWASCSQEYERNSTVTQSIKIASKNFNLIFPFFSIVYRWQYCSPMLNGWTHLVNICLWLGDFR